MDATPRNTNGSGTQDSGKTDSGYIDTIEYLKKKAPEFLDDLTKEFKSFILFGRVNIPQVVLDGAKAAGKFDPSPPLARLFPHIDLSDPERKRRAITSARTPNAG